MDVRLIGYTEDIEIIIAASAKATRDKPVDVLLDNYTIEQSRDFIGQLMSRGHEGISEFAFYIFAVKGVSRILTHQLVRHRIASYLQLSSRHMDLHSAKHVKPRKIKENITNNTAFEENSKKARDTYSSLMANGVHLEDARFTLPGALETHIVVGMNARTLNNFFGHRLCGKAQWEIAELAKRMHSLVFEKTPSLFWAIQRPCVKRGKCPEARSCGYFKTEEYKIHRNRYLKGYPNE